MGFPNFPSPVVARLLLLRLLQIFWKTFVFIFQSDLDSKSAPVFIMSR